MPGRLVSPWTCKLLEFRHLRIQESYFRERFARVPPFQKPGSAGAGESVLRLSERSVSTRWVSERSETPDAGRSRSSQAAPERFFFEIQATHSSDIESFSNLQRLEYFRNIRVVFCQDATCCKAQTRWTHWDLNPGPSTCEADVIPLHHVPLFIRVLADVSINC